VSPDARTRGIAPCRTAESLQCSSSHSRTRVKNASAISGRQSMHSSTAPMASVTRPTCHMSRADRLPGRTTPGPGGTRRATSLQVLHPVEELDEVAVGVYGRELAGAEVGIGDTFLGRGMQHVRRRKLRVGRRRLRSRSGSSQFPPETTQRPMRSAAGTDPVSRASPCRPRTTSGCERRRAARQRSRHRRGSARSRADRGSTPPRWRHAGPGELGSCGRGRPCRRLPHQPGARQGSLGAPSIAPDLRATS